MKLSGPGLLFAKFFLYYRLYFKSSDNCSNYLFLLDSVFMGCIFLETYPLLLGCPIYWRIIVHSILLWVFLYFCGIGFYFSSFISFFVYLVLSLFFLVSGQRFVNFVYPFKNPALGFIDFFF